MQPKRLDPSGSGRFSPQHIADAGVSPLDLRAVDAEREVLGAAMLDATACAVAVQLLRPDHFAGKHHHQIFEVIERLFSEGQPVNLVTIADTDPGLDTRYLTDVFSGVASTKNVEYAARVVIEKWIERRTLMACRRAIGQVGSDDIFDLIESLTYDLTQLTTGDRAETHISYAVHEAIKRAQEWKRGEKTDLMSTGIYGLDAAIGGFPVSELTTMAAPTGAGKTSWLGESVLGSARREAKRDKPRSILVFSAEMTREQLASRLASNAGEINLRQLRNGDGDDDAFSAYEDALIEVGQLPIHIDDTPNPTMQRIAARCQQIAATDGLCAVYVDYDEKIDSEAKSEELRVSAIAQGLKSIAKRFAVPVIALSQYSRAVTYDQWPSNEWLRYSSKKEHESALVLHWVWPMYWIDKGAHEERVKGYQPDRPGLGYIRCTKNRFGPQRHTELIFDERYTRFIDPKDPETPLHVRAKIRDKSNQDPF